MPSPPPLPLLCIIAKVREPCPRISFDERRRRIYGSARAVENFSPSLRKLFFFFFLLFSFFFSLMVQPSEWMGSFVCKLFDSQRKERGENEKFLSFFFFLKLSTKLRNVNFLSEQYVNRITEKRIRKDVID